MIDTYKTNIEDQKCNCGQADLMSAMFKKKVPCVHLYYLKMKFPKIDPPSLNIESPLLSEIFFEYKITPTERVETNSDYYTKMRLYAIKMIKRYSRQKKIEEITKFVENKLTFIETPTDFVLGYPVEVLETIDRGIIQFYKSKVST